MIPAEVRPFAIPLVGLALATLAFVLRVGVHVGRTPGGVDTWYFLASAEALRRTRRFPISLPQYVLQDRVESYPPGFILFLALIPGRWLRRNYWVVSPLIDTVSLLLLYTITLRLTGSITAAAVAGAAYALTPQLVSETRNLNPRAFGVLLASVAMLLVLRALLPPDAAAGTTLGGAPVVVIALALLASAALWLTHLSSAVAFSVAALGLTVVYGDPRYVAFPVAGLLGALVLTRGLYAAVLRNHLHAVRFWRRNGRFRGAHAIDHSPVYGSGEPPVVAAGGSALRRLIRLLGENPYLLPMLLAPLPQLQLEWWGQRLYWWALAILVWALATTFVPHLRPLGPGQLYMKASIFPTAFSLALAVGGRGGLATPVGIALLLALAASVAAIAYFYFYIRSRPTEQTASLPAGLPDIAAALGQLPGDGVVCLPTMYADYVCYVTGKRTLWGGHSGDLSRFESVSPVIRRPIDELMLEHSLRYALFDLAYVTPERLGLEGWLRPVARSGQFVVYESAR